MASYLLLTALYVVCGVLASVVGCYLRARAWRTTFTYQAKDAWSLWLLGVLFWPVGLDLLLMHYSPYGRNPHREDW